MEFAGLSIERTADIAVSAMGGELHQDSLARWRLVVDDLGEFAIELDWDYLKRRAAETEEGDDTGGKEWLLKTLKSAAALVVPMEVVCPPIALSKLDRLVPLTEALREAGAAGTADSVLAAFGVHINAEAPSMQTAVLTRFTKAFALLQWWLVRAHEVDLSRRITPYIDPYPQDYVVELLETDDEDTERFIDGYLAHNPSRNRALDLLPILSDIDAERVKEAVDDPRVKARPAFHYRLPNCHIARAGWTLADPWAPWLVVERIAADEAALSELSRLYLDELRPVLGASRRAWVDTVHEWLKDRALA